MRVDGRQVSHGLVPPHGRIGDVVLKPLRMIIVGIVQMISQIDDDGRVIAALLGPQLRTSVFGTLHVRVALNVIPRSTCANIAGTSQAILALEKPASAPGPVGGGRVGPAYATANHLPRRPCIVIAGVGIHPSCNAAPVILKGASTTATSTKAQEANFATEAHASGIGIDSHPIQVPDILARVVEKMVTTRRVTPQPPAARGEAPRGTKKAEVVGRVTGYHVPVNRALSVDVQLSCFGKGLLSVSS
jgi:hypothetical protein